MVKANTVEADTVIEEKPKQGEKPKQKYENLKGIIYSRLDPDSKEKLNSNICVSVGENGEKRYVIVPLYAPGSNGIKQIQMANPPRFATPSEALTLEQLVAGKKEIDVKRSNGTHVSTYKHERDYQILGDYR